MHPHLSALIADEHRRDLQRAAAHHRLVAGARAPEAPRPSWSRRASLRLPALVLHRRARVVRTPCQQP